VCCSEHRGSKQRLCSQCSCLRTCLPVMTSRLVAVLLASRIGQDPLTTLRYAHSKTILHHHQLIYIYNAATHSIQRRRRLSCSHSLSHSLVPCLSKPTIAAVTKLSGRHLTTTPQIPLTLLYKRSRLRNSLSRSPPRRSGNCQLNSNQRRLSHANAMTQLTPISSRKRPRLTMMQDHMIQQYVCPGH
jgi:hypothetical protein